ncbi:2-amino-3-ketobutyrate coenzyme A ligase [Deltaproteobacteria bacterium]|nr:2-amino-3-ketobutyrate coenzyme A ligase [Deltaproteobacteria bacterium]
MFTAAHAKLTTDLAAIREAGTWKNERVIVSPQGSTIRVASGQEVLNFCANNYLGLADHPALIEAAKAALDSHGLGMASVRFICGTQDIHKELEASVSRFLAMDDTILYSSCFDANGGLFETICGEGDAIISDELNHASIIDGIRLAKAERLRYKHLDLADLDAKLTECAGARVKLVATDGVFSMDGDIAPLAEICDVAEKHGALVMVDDSHASGFVGKTGRGSIEHCGVMGRVDVVTSTLGKALGGSQGGFTSGRKEIIDMLRQRSRPYLFSNTVAPPIVGAAIKVFEMLSESTERRDRLEANTQQFRGAMAAAGFKIRPGVHPICPLMLGDARLATEMADRMLQKGIYVIGFSFPVVPRGQARIRVQISAAHTSAQIDQAVQAFTEVGRDLGVIA